MSNNTLKRALLIRSLVEQYYEPGRQDRNRSWVFRNVIVKIYPISERTFWRYMSLTREKMNEQEPLDGNQLKLF